MVEDVKSMETNGMFYANEDFDGQGSYIFNNSGDIAETRICTARMLGVRNIARFVSTDKRAGHSSFIKVVYVLICGEEIKHLLSDVNMIARFTEAPKLCEDASIVDYIHNMDGEKDNNSFFI